MSRSALIKKGKDGWEMLVKLGSLKNSILIFLVKSTLGFSTCGGGEPCDGKPSRTVRRVPKVNERFTTTHILDQIKTLGFHQATTTSIALGIEDLLTIPSKG
uniref:DNA-directed RNA polymerase n=1 Tax=Oryza sativa subsp. japonica TaxID=39947 RepID=Q6ZI24_ORYSJ|nr:hypothetical protein [Oryza sativa Japonica Group]